jgi:hypothetical protein
VPGGFGQYNQPLRQSTWGKVSFIIAIVTLGIDVLLVGISMIAAEADINDAPGDAAASLMGLACCGSMVANLAGIVFGIIGLVERDKLRGMAIAGLIMNALPMLFIAGIMIFGLFMFNQAIDAMGP